MDRMHYGGLQQLFGTSREELPYFLLRLAHVVCAAEYRYAVEGRSEEKRWMECIDCVM